MFLDDAVGVAQHPVALLEQVLSDPGLLTAEADGQRRRALQLWVCTVSGVTPELEATVDD